MKRISIVLSSLLFLGFTGCQKVQVVSPATMLQGDVQKTVALPGQVVFDRDAIANPYVAADVKDKVYSQYREWKGTPYRRGGMSKRGIDCSGLTSMFYSNEFGIKLPRTVREQSKTGMQIRRSDLHPGDLVFFKTGFRSFHVGIYIEDGKFLHVSSSSGVMISNLDNSYWKNHYWQSRRI